MVWQARGRAAGCFACVSWSGGVLLRFECEGPWRNDARRQGREGTASARLGSLLPGWLPNFLGTEYEGTSGESTSPVQSSCRVPNICRVECAAWRATLASCQCTLYPIQCAGRSCHPLHPTGSSDAPTHPLSGKGDPHLPPTTPELKQNRRSAILSVLIQEEDTSLVHYGDPPTPTRVRDVSDGGRHNRAPSAATGMVGATLPVQPQVRGYLSPSVLLQAWGARPASGTGPVSCSPRFPISVASGLLSIRARPSEHL